MPFATIIGVNHYGQSILLGCTLVSHEDVESFKWLFMIWLDGMGNIHPTTIITDQYKSIKCAVREVMPDTIHRFCMWHIMCKVLEKFKHIREFSKAKSKFKALVYESLTISIFEEN